MKICYLLSRYISHFRVGSEYQRIITALGHELVDSPREAELVILHAEPPSYLACFEAFPELKDRYVVAYAVWETDQLPESYLRGLSLVQEIWTCSEFSQTALATAGAPVFKIPHPVRMIPADSNHVNEIKKRVGWQDDNYYFYTITDSINPRKNILALLFTFARLFPWLDRRVFLIVKQYRQALPYIAHMPNVISIEGEISEGHIHALHTLGHCYVSTHCAEAWGLSIADAMAYGKLVLATGYSGNMEYMSSENSIPLQYRVQPIRQEDLSFQHRMLTSEMRWAYVDHDDLAVAMKRAVIDRQVTTLMTNARKVCDRFGDQAIARLIDERLRVIRARIRC